MVRRRYEKREILLAVACVFLAIAFLTFYIWHQAALISLGYEASRLAEKSSSLEEEIKVLELRKASLLALDKVERIAREELHLTDPKPEQIIYEDFSEPGPR